MSISYESFRSVEIDDKFFDSLKQDYPPFADWFSKKAAAGESAYVFRYENKTIGGFLYLKVEEGPVLDVAPELAAARRVKIGTMKIEGHGTKLGERFLKKSFDWAIKNAVAEIYVTIFRKHAPLIALFERYGFTEVGSKGAEVVLLKNLGSATEDVAKSYPSISLPAPCYLLSIYPKWHTRLFPDSKLVTEGPELVSDISHTNSIHKVYLCNMKGVERLRAGDVIVVYRTAEEGRVAEYNSVATSICVVEEYREITSFDSRDEFLAYTSPYSVFTKEELERFWATKSFPKIIRFTYNVSLRNRLIRQKLADQVGLNRADYWGFLELSPEQLIEIIKLGGAVIPPFLAGCIRRIHAAIFSFMAGVMPPMPMFGRSLL